MTINERLALMDEIARKNDFEWNKYKKKPAASSMHPGMVFILEATFTFVAVLLMGAVALMA